VSGVLKAVDLLGSKVTIKTATGDLVLGVSSSTAMTLDGSATTLLTLSVNIGATVDVTHDSQTKVATKITAKSGSLFNL